MELELFDDLIDKISIYFDRSEIEIREALFLLYADKFDIEFAFNIHKIKIGIDEIVSDVNLFDFNTLNQVIIISNNLLPKNLIIEQKVYLKIKGQKYIIHKNDKDPFPSNPHAHHSEKNQKINLGNGECFEKRKFIGKISKKTLLRIRIEAQKVFEGELPDLQI